MKSLKKFWLSSFFGFSCLTVYAYPAGASADTRMVALPFNVELEGQSQTLMGAVKVPEPFPNPPSTSLPLILVFGGFEDAKNVLALFSPNFPCILASFDYPFSAPRKFVFPESLTLARDVKKSVHLMFEAIPRFIDKLISTYSIDISKIIVVGASFGAPFALESAGRDPRVRALLLVHGPGDPPLTVFHIAKKGFKKQWGFWGFMAAPMAWFLAYGGWKYLDVPSIERMSQALKPEQSVLVITALKDSFVPTEARTRLIQALRSSKAKVDEREMDTDHLQPGSESVFNVALELGISWLLDKGFLR